MTLTKIYRRAHGHNSWIQGLVFEEQSREVNLDEFKRELSAKLSDVPEFRRERFTSEGGLRN